MIILVTISFNLKFQEDSDGNFVFNQGDIDFLNMTKKGYRRPSFKARLKI
jgi:hypothetical protein